MSPDSNYVLLKQVPQGLFGLINQDLKDSKQQMGNLRINASQVRISGNSGGSPHAASAADSAATPASDTTETETPKKPEIAGGVLNYKATNDNSAYGITPQPRYFNILWMPDFDEQYVVTAKAGLGNAGVILGFGQGWNLQALDATVDNSAIAKPLLDFYSGTLGALQKLATAKIEAPIAALTGGPQSASAADTFKGGTPVTVKVTKVRIVAPGLYPILKPNEIGSLKLDDDQAKRVLAPVPPLTNIAFNTYDVIVIEAARTTGDSALRIQQYVESGSGAATPPSAAGGDGSPEQGMLRPFDAALKNLRIELSKPENATTKKEYFIPKIEQGAGGVLKVTLTKRSDGPVGTLPALPDDTALKAMVVAILSKQNVSVTADNISITR